MAQQKALILAISLALSVPAWGADSQQCYTGGFGGDSPKITKSDIVNMILQQLQASANTVMESNIGFKSFMESRKQCQHDCFKTVLRASVSTLAGKIGKEILSSTKAVQDLANKAITGAFKACYPSPPRAEVMKMVDAVTTNMGKSKSDAEPPPFPEGLKCEGPADSPGLTEEDFLKGFLPQLGQAMETAAVNSPGVLELFGTKAKDCQKKCMETTLTAAAKNLFGLGRITDSEADISFGSEAFTGALKACFPGEPRDDVKAFVEEVANSFRGGAPKKDDSTMPASQMCYTGDFQGGLSKDAVVGMLVQALGKSTASVMEQDDDFKKFMVSRKQCQNDCFLAVLHTSVSTLAGNLGKDVLSDTPAIQVLANDAITGAFKACYPSPPREQVLKMVKTVTSHMSEASGSASASPLPEGDKCTGPENLPDGFTVDKFLVDFGNKFGEAFLAAVEKMPDVQKFFKTKAKDCQISCMGMTVVLAAKNLFELDKWDDGTDAFTGALKACFPSAPRDVVKTFVEEIDRGMDAANAASPAAAAKYAAGRISAPQATFQVPLVAMALTAGAALMAIGGVLGFRRLQRRRFVSAEAVSASAVEGLE